MDISLPAEFRQFIDEQVNRGHYQSPSEVLCEGLRLMQNRDRAYAGRFEVLKQEILQGIESVQPSSEQIDGEATLQEIRAQFQQKRIQASL